MDLRQMDLSGTNISLAGPDRVYLSPIVYAGQEVSVILQYDGTGGFTVLGPYLPS